MTKRRMILALAVLAVALLGFARPAMARDYANDVTYGFHFDYSGASQGTPGERKGNTSPCYVYIKQQDGSAELFIDGAYTRSGPWSNMMYGTHAYASPGAWCIHSNVRETYGARAYARLTAIGGKAGGSLSGEWSADSTKSWPSLN